MVHLNLRPLDFWTLAHGGGGDTEEEFEGYEGGNGSCVLVDVERLTI